MANFLELPIAASTSISSPYDGQPFTADAVNVGGSVTGGGVYAATNAGTVYAANVAGKLAFVCIGSGYYGYTWVSRSTITTAYECLDTPWSSVYAVETPLSANLMGTTEFPTFDAMTEMFWNQYLAPDPSTTGVVVTVIGYAKDPMDGGGTSGEEPPTGDFDDESDEVPEPTVPIIGAQNSGMIALFRPSLEQVQDLGKYLWTHIDDIIPNLQKYFTNPMDYVISFHIVPCVPSVGSSRAINIGNFLTTIEMPPCVSQWYNYDFGNVTISPYSGTYLDYSPYTKIQLMLPFLGSVTLNTDEVMGHLIGLKYHIDLLSGQFVALVSIDGSYRYQYTGACSVSVPLTGSNWSRVYTAAIGAIGTAITGGVSMAGGAASATAGREAAARSYRAAGTLANAWRNTTGIKGAPAMREQIANAAQAAVDNANAASAEAGLAARSVSASKVAATISGTVGSVMGAKHFVSHSGSIGGAAGMLGIRQPFVIIEYPNQSLADNYKHFVGYPANISGKLKEFSGYTECEQVVPDKFSGTDEELGQVLDLLKEGVYL